MHIVNISEAKAHLAELIEGALAGDEVIIAKAGKPVVKLVRFEANMEPRRPGALRGLIRTSDDFDTTYP